MVVYKTKAGQMWDEIAFEVYGDCRYTADLLKANPDLLGIFIFSANIEVVIPEIEEPATTKTQLPAWWN